MDLLAGSDTGVMSYPQPPQQPQYPFQPQAPVKKKSSTGRILLIVGLCIFVCCVGTAVIGLIRGVTTDPGKTSNAGQQTPTIQQSGIPATEPASPASPAPPPPPAGPATSFKDGTYEVGKEIMAGTYTCVAYRTVSGYWERAKDAEGSFSSIIANDNISPGAQGIVTVKAGEFFKAERLNCTIR